MCGVSGYWDPDRRIAERLAASLNTIHHLCPRSKRSLRSVNWHRHNARKHQPLGLLFANTQPQTNHLAQRSFAGRTPHSGSALIRWPWRVKMDRALTNTHGKPAQRMAGLCRSHDTREPRWCNGKEIEGTNRSPSGP
jgi:hypothetical protein